MSTTTATPNTNVKNTRDQTLLVSEGDFASDWSEAGEAAQPQKTGIESVFDLASQGWSSSDRPRPLKVEADEYEVSAEDFLSSSPPQVAATGASHFEVLPDPVTISSQELNALVDDPEWGFEEVTQTKPAPASSPTILRTEPASSPKIPKPETTIEAMEAWSDDFNSSFPEPLLKSTQDKVKETGKEQQPVLTPLQWLASSAKDTKSSAHAKEEIENVQLTPLEWVASSAKDKTNSAHPKGEIDNIPLTPSQRLAASSFSWSPSPESHRTDTLFSRRVVQDFGSKNPGENRILSSSSSLLSSGNKRRLESPAKSTTETSPKTAKTTTTTTPLRPATNLNQVNSRDEKKEIKKEHEVKRSKTWSGATASPRAISPTVGLLGKLPKTTITPTITTTTKTSNQIKLTSFVSPLVRKAHASTLATDLQNQQVASLSKAPIAPIFLTEEQRRILSLIVDEGRNVFFTGAAGTGKSVLLRRVISELRRKYRNRTHQPVAVTASTGLAACNIGGMTLHSFGGIGLGEEPVSRLVEKIRKNKKANRRWKDTKVLVIDEISMIDGGLFDKLEEIARIINKSEAPFGGIQLVITGDFFQLPPVFKPGAVAAAAPFRNEAGGFQVRGDGFLDDLETEGKFSFEAQSWKSVVTTTVELKQVFRQKDDRFSAMLNSIRGGTVTPEIEAAFKQLARTPDVPGDITPTELFPLRWDVDNANRVRMGRLAGREVLYEAQDMYTSEMAERAGKLDLLMCPKSLRLKRGAQVMLVKNMDETLVNGSLGKVIGFMSESSFKLTKELPPAKAERVINGELTAETAVEEFFEDMANERRCAAAKRREKKEKALKEEEEQGQGQEQEHKFDDVDFEELLVLEQKRLEESPQSKAIDDDEDEAVVVTSGVGHKSRRVAHGFTSDAEEDNPAFEEYQEEEDDDDDVFGLKDASPDLLAHDPSGINFARKKALLKLLSKSSSTGTSTGSSSGLSGGGQSWPYVRFLLPDGTMRDLLVQPETWTLEDAEGRTEASRSQVPLILAWALSIHKSQGQTLEWVKVDLARVFEKGQAYVALSRAVRMEGLQVLGFEKSKIMVHPKVIQFYSGLVSALDVKDEDFGEEVKEVKERRPRRRARKLAG